MITLLCGDAIEQLQTLPANSVQTCCTSPPYYGLRAYGTNPQIWDAVEGCEHVWGEGRRFVTGNAPSTKTTLTGGMGIRESGAETTAGQFCQVNGCWRGELGSEPTVAMYTTHLTAIFREVHRVLRPDGTCWIVIGNSYAGSGKGAWDNPSNKVKEVYIPRVGEIPKTGRGFKPKDLIPAAWLLGLALQQDGWWLRSDIIWQKPNAMPSSVRDRPTVAHEYVLMLTKRQKYYYNAEAVREPAAPLPTKGTRLRNVGGRTDGYTIIRVHVGTPNNGRNRRSVWTTSTQAYGGAHYAAYPEKLVEPMILAGSRPGDTVLDPFCGTGTTGKVALAHGRSFIGIDLNPAYLNLIRERLGITDESATG